MKTHFSTALVILTVSVAVSVNGAPPVANSAIPTTETSAGAFIPSSVSGAMNPRPVVGQMPPGAVGGLLSANGFLGPLTPGPTFVNGIPGGSLDPSPSGTLRDPAPIASTEGTLSGNGLGGVPASWWQNLPSNTEIPAAARPLKSNAAPTEVHRALEERDMISIQRLVREGGLRTAHQSEGRFTDQMSPAQSFQPDVSFSGYQINILKTFLR
jgi:hypothetical protein